ncbi:MAG: AraC family transcriptional regulator [Erythrobacter sp.]
MVNRHSIAILLHAVCPILRVDAQRALEMVPWASTTKLGSDLMVSAADFLSLWNTIIELAEEGTDTLFLGRMMANGPVVPIFLAFSAAPNMGEGLRRLARYKTLFGPVALHLTSQNGGLRLEIRSESSALDLPASLSVPIGVFVVEKSRSHSARHIAPTLIELPGNAVDHQNLSDYFGQATGSGDTVVLEFCAADVSAPFLSENHDLWLEIEKDLEGQLTRQAAGEDFHHQVEAAVRRALTVGPARVDAICEDLGVSRSTMQRRLKVEGRIYQEVLDAVRKELAIRYLSKSKLMPSQIAGLVGFSDTKSFHRAFKAWTNKPPGEFRKQLER